ncbi:hypothetical protein BB561_001163 [Smittium simulii]|uniref:Enoyl reductase (ER) domain-containing protein n=1 Tax=Smittium simulii TaxID=133385 RepID=A0A2T9YVR7_9FUNG|nr:hypothetical protein BB561_001163 [Smittium simulii]
MQSRGRLGTKRTFICQSDICMIKGKTGNENYPIIPGHEASGIVESVGSGVTKFQVGDHVIPLVFPNCDECALCISDKTNFCAAFRLDMAGLMLDGTSRLSLNGKIVYNFLNISSFSEYTVTSVHGLTKIKDSVPLNRACFMNCCVPTAFGAVNNTVNVFEGARVAVFGCGALGLCTIQAARAAKASRIVAIDINESKFVVAKEFGATDFINPLSEKYANESVESIIYKMFPGGVDFSFEATGAGPSVMNSAFESVCVGWGKSVIYSVMNEKQNISTLPINFIKGKTWTATAVGQVKKKDYSKFADMYESGDIMLDSLVTDTLPIEQINTAIDNLQYGNAIRSIITFS